MLMKNTTILLALYVLSHLPSAAAGGIPANFMLAATAPELIASCNARLGVASASLQQEYSDWLAKQSSEIRQAIKPIDAARQNAAKDKNAPVDPELREFRRRQEALSLDEMKIGCRELSEYFRGVAPAADPARKDAETTWNSFVGAMRSGDKPGARKYLGGAALDNFRGTFETADAQKMVEWAKRITKFSLVGDASQGFQEAAVNTRSGHVFFIYFNAAGPNWIISSM